MSVRVDSIVAAIVLVGAISAYSGDVKSLDLVPFPKQVELGAGSLAYGKAMTLEVPETMRAVAGRLVVDELARAGHTPPPSVVAGTDKHSIRLVANSSLKPRTLTLRKEAGDQDYALLVEPGGVTITANSDQGLHYGVATLCQLIRANSDGGIPCVGIRDWPSITWRAIQDDMTRGPSTKLSEMKRDVDRAAMLKLNIFTYYMEYQFAFSKHPSIGPRDGSFTPAELAALVEHAKGTGVNILGCQQSFAHMSHVLREKTYEQLAETDSMLSPAVEGTYDLLGDMYADVVPLVPFGFFNVCCDEAGGIGNGPARDLAAEITPEGVYLRHIRRLHDMIGKYGKRMMMWGDIIERHPDRLSEVPRDVVMMSWNYGAGDSFEHKVKPYAEAGYDFFVCPGVNNWRRVLPDFHVARINIHNFVRDGAEHGAMGVLTTSWDDDGENLNAPNWYGFAWGAECAWNASATPVEDFNNRVGAVLFGPGASDYGKAVDALIHAGCAMRNGSFWKVESIPVEHDQKREADAGILKARKALSEVEHCRARATVDADLLDAVLFGAKRLELNHQRVIARFEAADAYDHAFAAISEGEDPEYALNEIETAIGVFRSVRDTYAALRAEWSRLWLSENKPYRLDRCLARYDATIKRYDDLLGRLASAKSAAENGDFLPAPEEIELPMCNIER